MVAAPTRTPEGDALFFAALSIGDTVAQACLAAGYARSCVYEWRRKDAAFAEGWNGAVYTALTAEADRRLGERYWQPVYRNGVVMGYRHNCPDLLLFERYSALRAECDHLHALHMAAPAAPPPRPAAATAPRPNLFARWRERLAWLWRLRAKERADAG